MTTIRIECRDPVVCRDGRPFGKVVGEGSGGNAMRSLSWPTPSAVAGSLRTAVGKAEGVAFTKEDSDALFKLEVAGVFPLADGQLYLPAPADCVRDETNTYAARPEAFGGGAGCDLPPGLLPVTVKAGEGFKPKPVPAWWPLASYAKWLMDEEIAFDSSFLGAPVPEERTHVVMNSDTGAGIDGQLFSTAALPLTHLPKWDAKGDRPFAERYAEIALTARAKAANWCSEALEKVDLHPLGGERRLVRWTLEQSDDLWKCPDESAAKLAGAGLIRMVLATPAIFEDGWKPGWLDEKFEGTPPGTDVKLKLVGFTTGRWKAISGWSYQPQPGCPKPGPKPIRRMVPAGGVYFFDYVSGDRAELAGRWLHSVSDDIQTRRDGFGLACWGTWKYPEENA